MSLKTAFLTIFLAALPMQRLAAQQNAVINEIMYDPIDAEPQWIELYNTDSTNFNIAGWQIATSLGAVTLPINAITADQNYPYLVITADSNALRSKRPGNYPIVQCSLPVFDTLGDEIVLKNAATQTMDSVVYLPSWGGSKSIVGDAGNSLERRNALAAATEANNWGTSIAISGATPGARNSLAVPDSTTTVTATQPLDIVMNELMVEVTSPEPQWIELLNTTKDTINIAGWTITVKDHTPVVIPALNSIIAPDSMQILSSNDTAVAHYRKIPTSRIIQLSLPHMDYGGSTVALHDVLGDLIDSVWYDGSWIKGYGISLERINPEAAGYDSTNWGACVDPTGSTILRPNSIRIRNYSLVLVNAQMTDTSITVTLVNLGLDTIRQPSVALQIGEVSSATLFAPVIQALFIDLPSGDSIAVKFPLPNDFYGSFPATAYIIDSLNENLANDTIHFSVSAPIPQDSLVLNEIMFNPQPGGSQWLEFYNLSNKWISMDSVQLLTGESHPGEFIHTIPPLLIAPDSFGLVAANDSIYSDYPALADRSGIASLNESSLDLGIDSCFVALHNYASPAVPDASIIDSVHYFKTWQHSTLTTTFAGISLERVDSRSASNDPGNWQASLDTLGATPLAPNSVRIRNYELALTNAQPTDSSVAITIANIGIDTIRHTAVALQIGSLPPIVQQISTILPSHDSLLVPFLVPNNFYGLFPATAYLMDSLNQNPVNDTLRFSVSPPIPQDSIVINEIMFDPQPNGCEWLELYNLTSEWISMDSTRLITGESRPGEYTHVIPPLLIAPDSFGLIAANDSIYARYPALVGRNGIATLGESSLDMGEDSCFVVLHNNKDSTSIDSVHYFRGWQQSLLKKTFAGISLERIDPRGPSNDPQNWHASLDTLGATPLAPNSGDTSSTTTPTPSGTVFEANFAPNPFSPDGDGFEDVSVLTVQTGNSTEWAMQVTLFDASGRLVRTLTNATTVLGSIALTFDGKRDNGQTLPPGLYTVLVELTSASPIQTLKAETGVAIAGKRR